MGSSRFSLRRLRSFARLSATERRLALRALGWLVLARVVLRLVSFARLRGWLDARPAVARGPAEWPFDVRRAVGRAGRTLPGSSCLARALVAELLLRQGGHPARLTIGVAPAVAQRSGPPRVSLDAHAWVESGGVLVAGYEDRERYAPLTAPGVRG